MTVICKRAFSIITEHKNNVLKAFSFHRQMKTLIQTIIHETQIDQILSGLVFSPGDKRRLFSECFQHLCSVIMGKFLVHIGDISLNTLNENFYIPCYV
jgi:F0F1-type ATP synthase delta subunit